MSRWGGCFRLMRVFQVGLSWFGEENCTAGAALSLCDQRNKEKTLRTSVVYSETEGEGHNSLRFSVLQKGVHWHLGILTCQEDATSFTAALKIILGRWFPAFSVTLGVWGSFLTPVLFLRTELAAPQRRALLASLTLSAEWLACDSMMAFSRLFH